MRKQNVQQATQVLLGQEPVPDFFPDVGEAQPQAEEQGKATPEEQVTQAETPTTDETKSDENKFHEELHQASEDNANAKNETTDLGDEFENAIEELGALISTSSDSKEKQEASPAPSSEKPQDEAKLSHVNEAGAAHMVDISDKSVTQRLATAEGFVAMQADTLAQIQQNAMKKGDVLATARIAGIMAAKKTSDLIPLCHPLPVTGVEVEFTPVTNQQTGIHVRATVKVDGKTGVEMEALTAVSVSCLTIYDMAKAIDKGMSFSGVRLLEKSGGKSGPFRATDAAE
jgi:cyclic pyranopterin phosphate synthase